MRKILVVLLAFVMLIGLIGCTPKEAKENTANNDVFTDELLDGAKQMSLLGVAGPISGAEMDKVVQILQTASLVPVEEGVTVNEGDAYLLLIAYKGGTSRAFYVSDGIIAFNEVDGARYFVAEGSAFLAALLQAFGVDA